MVTNSASVEAEIDRLYGLPLAEFTSARDAVAKQRRSAGDRVGAAEIKRLRKPTVAAWALNQVHRDDRGGVERLMAAGQALRDGHARLLAEGDREPLALASAEHRQLVKDLARHAERQLVAAGQPVSAAVSSKLWGTLRAVAGDPEAGELFAAGRLVHDYELSDLGFALAPAGGPTAPPAETAPSARTETAADTALARKIRTVRQRLERSRARRQEMEEKLADAQTRVEAARREAAQAAAALERAEAVAERATAGVEETSARVAEFEATLLELESRSAGAGQAQER